jgi:phosphoribosylformimino-5-aminoimidazole carboxamide ribotide isomerase
MIVLPAIDIKDKQCVRLYKGDFSRGKVVASDYMQTALSFKAAGAKWIHMVDLDAAKSASSENRDIFVDVAKHSGLSVELGGGIRDLDTAEKYLSAGISRVVIGSAAVSNPELITQMINAFGAERIAVGIDAKDGYVSTHGWLKDSGMYFTDLAADMCRRGVKYIIFTDIDRDGTLTSPNFTSLSELQSAVDVNIIASAGVKTIEDIRTLRGMKLYGAICGMSIYAGTLNLKVAIGEARI